MVDENILDRHIVFFNAVIAVIAVFVAVRTVAIFLPEFKRTEKISQIDESLKDSKFETIPVYEDYIVIEERNLFSSKEGIFDEGQKTFEIVPTSLQLILLGTIVAGGEDKSYAIIEDVEKKDQGLYEIGDKILDAKIINIKRNEVVLQRGQQREILYAFVSDVSSKESLMPAVGSGDEVKKPSGISAVEEVGINRWRVSKSKAIQEIGSLNNVLNGLKIKPKIVNGKIRGMIVDNVSENNVLTALGVHEGDVVEGVNGKGITTMRGAFEIFRGLKDSKDVSVVVKRGDKRVVLDYQLVD